MFYLPTAPNLADKIAAGGARFLAVCAQRRPVPTQTTDTVPNRDRRQPPPSAPFPHSHLPAPRGFVLPRFVNVDRHHQATTGAPRSTSKNLQDSGHSLQMRGKHSDQSGADLRLDWVASLARHDLIVAWNPNCRMHSAQKGAIDLRIFVGLSLRQTPVDPHSPSKPLISLSLPWYFRFKSWC